MGIERIIDDHFFNGQIQLAEDSGVRNALGMASVTMLATAAIGYTFFRSSAFGCAALSAAAVGFGASFATGKDGYAWAVVGIGAAGLALSSITAIQEGRFFVQLRIDIVEILRLLLSKA